MTSNHSDVNTLPIYKLYFDDIEEIFFNGMSFKLLSAFSIAAVVAAICSLVILAYRSKMIFFACLIPFVYSLLFYDLVQLLSILLLRYNLLAIHEQYFSEFCRWPYYLKASAEGGQCLTLVFIYTIRCQKVRYFLKHNCVPSISRVHSRALACVCLLVIVYVNNWITHLKVEKIHLVTVNESNYEINIQEYPIALYGVNEVKLNNYSRFYADLDKYAQHYQRAKATRAKPEKIIHTHKDDSIYEVIIKFPYPNLFGTSKAPSTNHTRRKFKKLRRKFNRSLARNHSYHVHRCTFGQRNFSLTSVISSAHCVFYLLLIIYQLVGVYRCRIPLMSIEYHRNSFGKAAALGQNKYAEQHRQLILLCHLRHLQYLVVFCHTTLLVIRLVYICALTMLLCLAPSPFQWLPVKIIFYALFCLVYYSIPVRLILLFCYLFYSLFSSHLHSIVYYIFRGHLHCSCQCRRPTIRFRLQFVPRHHANVHDRKEQSTKPFMMEFTSSGYEEQSTSYPNESVAVGEESSGVANVAATGHFAVMNEVKQSQL